MFDSIGTKHANLEDKFLVFVFVAFSPVLPRWGEILKAANLYARHTRP